MRYLSEGARLGTPVVKYHPHTEKFISVLIMKPQQAILY